MADSYTGKAQLFDQYGHLIADVHAELTKTTTPAGITDWRGLVLPTTEDGKNALMRSSESSYTLRIGDDREGRVQVFNRRSIASKIGSKTVVTESAEVNGSGAPPF